MDGWSRAAKIQHRCRCFVALSTLEAASVLIAVKFVGQTDADVVLVVLHCTSRALIFSEPTSTVWFSFVKMFKRRRQVLNETQVYVNFE